MRRAQRGGVLLAVLVATRVAAVGAAELRFDYVTAQGAGAPLMSQSFRVSAQAVEVTMGPSAVYLFTREDRRLFIVNHASKTYIPVDGQVLARLDEHLTAQRQRISGLLEKKELAEDPTVRAALETSIAQIDGAIRNARVLSVRKKELLEAKATGAQKTFEGIECDVYRISLAGGSGEGCYAELDAFGVASRSMQAVLDAMAAIEEMSGVGSPFTAVEGAFPVHSRLGAAGLGVQASLKNFRVIEPAPGEALQGLPEGYEGQQFGAP